MFASGTFESTYSGPILASGENVRRARNDARAMAAFAGQPRAFMPQVGGVGAGSRMNRYRAGLEADRRTASSTAVPSSRSLRTSPTTPRAAFSTRATRPTNSIGCGL